MDIKVMGQGGSFNLNTEVSQTVQLPSDKDVNVDVVQDEEKHVSKDLKKAVNKLNNFLKDEHTHAEYSVHEKLGTLMIKIVDDSTKETIMELPPKKILDMVAKMCELAGVVYDKKA
jgi:flagellar protein FlaG